MQVRAKCTHYNGVLRHEGEQFEHNGPLHEHIEPVKPKAKQAEKGKQAEEVNGTDEE
jgi:hypothetical protein